jgi:2-methylcitrate dehydratase PrpD
MGHSFRAELDDAIFANAVMGHSIDFDDSHKFVHPGCVVVPVVLGLAEWHRASGRDALAALVAGYDVSVRISLAAGPAHRERGFHPTGTCNVFGAAAAACRLMNLSSDALHSALGLAASQACSVLQYRANGAPIKHLHAGFAARGALLSARLAAAGFPAAVEPIEGEFGFLAAYVGPGETGPLTADLGRRYMIAETDIKPYPSCRQTHAPVDLALEAIRRHGVTPEQVASATLWIYRSVAEKRWMTSSEPPVSPLAGMLSLPFCMASALVDGHLSLPAFDSGSRADPVKLALARRITIRHDEALTARWPNERPVRLELELVDGRAITLAATDPRGGAAAPLSYTEIVDKFLRLAEPVIGPRAGEFVARVERLEEVDDMAQIAGLLGMKEGRSGDRAAIRAEATKVAQQ